MMNRLSFPKTLPYAKCNLSILFFLLLLNICSCKNRAGVILLIEEDYRGKGIIMFNIPNKQPLKYNNGYYYAVLPHSGYLETSTSLKNFEDQFFSTVYVDQNYKPINLNGIS